MMDLSVKSLSPSSNNRSITGYYTSKRVRLSSSVKRYTWIYSFLLLSVILLMIYTILSSKEEDIHKPIILQEKSSRLPFIPPKVPEEAFIDCPPPGDKLKDNEPTCRWKFSHYEPSFYEKMWHDNINEWSIEICYRVSTDQHLRASRVIVRQIMDLKKAYPNTTWSTVDSIPAGKLEEDYELMSRFHYQRECYDSNFRIWKPAGKGVQLIEPLWGWLRDPFDSYCNLTSKKLSGWNGDQDQSKEHMMPLGYAPYGYTLEDGEIPDDQWRSHGIPPWKRNAAPDEDPNLNNPYGPPRRIALDLGASYFNYWIKPEWFAGASSKWLYKMYHKKGIRFDRFIGFEYMNLSATEQWSQIPEDVFHGYRFFNAPVSIDPNSASHIAKIIRTYVRPNDFFAFKFDIDSLDIEGPFAFSLLNDDSMAGLIDEFYFEHHVDCDAMRAWGFDMPQNMTDSYTLYTGLRNKGMRTHSWP